MEGTGDWGTGREMKGFSSRKWLGFEIYVWCQIGGKFNTRIEINKHPNQEMKEPNRNREHPLSLYSLKRSRIRPAANQQRTPSLSLSLQPEAQSYTPCRQTGLTVTEIKEAPQRTNQELIRKQPRKNNFMQPNTPCPPPRQTNNKRSTGTSIPPYDPIQGFQLWT
jgi:hypothetical protein